MAAIPEIFILAGPNGAGKSTGASLVLPHRLRVREFVNADDIQRSLGPGVSPVTAGRLAVSRMRALRDARESFAFETTLSGKTYLSFLREAQNLGYFIHLAYISLRTPELAKQRVADRVAEGGHAIPPDDIERRFWRSLRNFSDIYCPLANSWTLCDNSDRELVIVAQGGKGMPTMVYDQERYSEIQNAAKQRP